MAVNNNAFIEKIGEAAVKYYSKYKILPSLTIAQAILESAWGRSGLAKDCNNFFGMKWTRGCGCDFKIYTTSEQRANGTYYKVEARFRKYKTVEDGIKGYYDFLQYPRYKNLKGVVDYKEVCKLIRLDGWATSLTYTQNLIKLIETYNLNKYDKLALENKNASYFKKYSGDSKSLVDALNSLGYEFSYAYRKTVAHKNGITTYSGKAAENTKLLNLLKKGKLIKP